ncbi:MAG: hypothetical protein ABH843_05485 [Candidatus Omnitrophota bacterium]
MRENIPAGLRTRDIFLSLFFLAFVSITAHLLFSWRGFNLTDNGYIMAYSRRILNGQIPHRDFIYICPAGSPFLHTPSVFFGGNYAFWLSRLFVWFQFASIAWAWIYIIDKFLGGVFNRAEKFSFGLIGFALSAHNFPIMSWTTIDGLFLASAGIAFCASKLQNLKFLGYLLLGSSYLCRQSFLPPAFFSIFILGDWRRQRFWLALGLPGVIYTVYLYLNGALPDAILQIAGMQTDWETPGIIKYIVNKKTILAGMLCGLLGLSLISGKLKVAIFEGRNNARRLAGVIAAYFPVLAMAVALGLGRRIMSCSYALFGAALGVLLYIIIEAKKQPEAIRVGALVLLATWCASISVLYTFPGIASGLPALFLIGYVQLLNVDISKNSPLRKALIICQILLVAITVVNFGITRIRYDQLIYGTGPTESKYPLGGLFPGANMIKADFNTYQLLSDLKEAIDKAEGSNYIIVPDFAAWWVKSKKENILPVEWIGTYGPYFTKNSELRNRAIETLKANRADTIVIVHRVKTTFSNGFTFLAEEDYGDTITPYVFRNFKMIGNTRFFELYKQEKEMA